MAKVMNVEGLRHVLRALVLEEIGGHTPDERAYQDAVAKSIKNAGTTKTLKDKPADKKAPAVQANPNEADAEDDIFAGADKKKDKPAPEKPASPASPAASPSKPVEKSPDAPRQNRNSPEAAKFSLAAAQDRAHEKEQQAAKVVPTPKPADLSFDMVVTALNILRSGQSLKNQQIRGQVEQYFNSLQGAERTALYSYLSGIAQIVAANVPSAQAPSPDDSPNPVSMEFVQGDNSTPKDPSQQSSGPKKDSQKVSSPERSSEDRAGRNADKKKPRQDDDIEDTTPPISVGSRNK